MASIGMITNEEMLDAKSAPLNLADKENYQPNSSERHQGSLND